jgi:hypothetical protein
VQPKLEKSDAQLNLSSTDSLEEVVENKVGGSEKEYNILSFSIAL